MLLIQHVAAPGAVLLKLKGELRAPDDHLLTRAARQFVTSDARLLLLDLEKVTDVDAAGLGALVAARNIAFSVGATTALLNPDRHVVKLLAITKLTSVFEVIADDAADVSSERQDVARWPMSFRRDAFLGALT